MRKAPNINTVVLLARTTGEPQVIPALVVAQRADGDRFGMCDVDTELGRLTVWWDGTTTDKLWTLLEEQ